MTRSIIIRADPLFKKEIESIKIERLKQGTDDKLRSDRRMTKALRKLSYWDKIKNDLIIAQIEDDRFKE